MSENENNQYRLLSPWAYVGYGRLFAVTGEWCWWWLSCRLSGW